MLHLLLALTSSYHNSSGMGNKFIEIISIFIELTCRAALVAVELLADLKELVDALCTVL